MGFVKFTIGQRLGKTFCEDYLCAFHIRSGKELAILADSC
jgi:hypothetical protein